MLIIVLEQLVALALVSHVSGQGLIAYALAHLPTAFSSLTMVLEVFAAAFLGWVFLNEPLGLWQWAGAAVIIAGLVVARRGEAFDVKAKEVIVYKEEDHVQIDGDYMHMGKELEVKVNPKAMNMLVPQDRT